ncbi:hypothetical protein E2562_000296 [Oryza meyeriana var. granulata]|uniref:Uncharacterized protein n=1 Tax=Oryza meyeriana var. granulata TaxID=110450 RepID=A0A6G1CL85_9ORYZ|nr:hypothetical protein E2562_000296 [Oryza meyeriana var. granulata]
MPMRIVPAERWRAACAGRLGGWVDIRGVLVEGYKFSRRKGRGGPQSALWTRRRGGGEHGLHMQPMGALGSGNADRLRGEI